MLQLLFLPPSLRRGRTYFLITLAIVCLGWAAYAAIEACRPHGPDHLRLGAGTSIERRYQIAEYLAEDAKNELVDVELLPTGGSNDAIAKIADGSLDAAIINASLKVQGDDRIKLVAGLDIAPLHILVKKELAASTGSLADMIRGHRVHLGDATTNDRDLSREIMGFLKVQCPTTSSPGDFIDASTSKTALTQLANEATALTGDDREKRLRALPDVAMVVGTMPSNVAQYLLDTGIYTLVPFPYAKPFLMTDAGGDADGISRKYVETVTIPAAMYVEDVPTPAAECPSVGLQSILVTRADLPKQTVRRLMKTVFETNFTTRINPRSPRDLSCAYGIHPGAIAYLDSHKPLMTGEIVDSISTMFSVFGAFSAGALSLYGYMRRRRIRRPGEYLDEIRSIDALATKPDAAADANKLPETFARELDERLMKVKKQLIEDYCDNRVQGELVLMSILSMLADSRSNLRQPDAKSPISVPRADGATDQSRRAA